MTTRRTLIQSALAAAAMALPALAARAGGKTPKTTFQQGGWSAPTMIQRIEAGLFGPTSDRGYRTIHIPQPGVVYFIPLDVLVGAEDGGTRYGFMGDGCLTIKQLSLYDGVANIDWPGQSSVDYGLRKLLVMCTCDAAPTPPVYAGPGVPVVIPANNGYRCLSAHDTPGSTTGPSADAWTYSAITAADLAPGTKVFLAVRIGYAGDFIQADQSSFLRLVNRSA